jgi:hypothetical protein
MIMKLKLANCATAAVGQSISKLKLSLFALALLTGAGHESSASHLNIAGLWQCTVNARSADPDGNYGLELEVQMQNNNTLYARGIVIYVQLANSIQKIEGQGDWSVSPAEGNKGEMIKFRMQPQSHPIVTWFAPFNGTGSMYNLFSFTNQQGAASTVETQCNKRS